MVIGGVSANGQKLPDTYILDSARQKWFPGPVLLEGRMRFGYGMDFTM